MVGLQNQGADAMIDKLRARAKELAEGAAGQVLNDWPAHQRLVSLFEAAILAGMREALREEPDGLMLEAAIQAPIKLVMLDSISARKKLDARGQWEAMAEARARGLE
jgi:hypothetical protein